LTDTQDGDDVAIEVGDEGWRANLRNMDAGAGTVCGSRSGRRALRR